MPSMLNPERIPIGKLKQAYGLSALEVDELLAALWPNGVFPYDLWEKAYIAYWKDAALHNAAFHLAGAAPVLPEIDQRMYETTPLYPYRTLIVKFFESLSVKIFVYDLEKSLRYITEETYGEGDNAFKENIDYILDRLADAEKEHDLGIFPPYRWPTYVPAEKFRELMDTKILSVASCCYSFISDLFTDTIIVDKPAAMRYLFDCGYKLRHEVKGVSHALVDRITASSGDHTQINIDDPLPMSPSAPIIIPRALWQGKENAAVVNAMRERKDKDYVIAHVLFEWCGLKNKIEIGQLLRGHPTRILDDSTYAKQATACLKEAAAYRIESS
jgi:hypothetical protein